MCSMLITLTSLLTFVFLLDSSFILSNISIIPCKFFVISTEGRNLEFVHYIQCFQISPDGRNDNIANEDPARTY